jgi:hypothetical protein
MTQFLSISVTPALKPADDDLDKIGAEYGHWWLVARQLAQWQLRSADAADRVWAHSTLAELELLGVVYADKPFKPDTARTNIAGHCGEICNLSRGDVFPVMSTQRQFRRYLDHWPRDKWNELAQAALNALEQGQSAA